MYLAKILAEPGPAYFEVSPSETGFLQLGPANGPDYDPLPAYHGPGFERGTPLDRFLLLAPVKPTKIVCVGRNYRDHAAELGNEVPKQPLLFLKPPSSLVGSGATVLMPAVSTRVDFEGELAVVISRRCHKLSPGEDIRSLIRGYTLVNDVTARDLQKPDGQWTRAKGFDTFCPTGPVLLLTEPSAPAGVDFDPLSKPVHLTTQVNGETRQSAATSDFLFDIPTLIRYISRVMTLEPGDLIPTGTPAGVGPLSPRDVVSVSVPGLGTLANPFAAE